MMDDDYNALCLESRQVMLLSSIGVPAEVEVNLALSKADQWRAIAGAAAKKAAQLRLHALKLDDIERAALSRAAQEPEP